MERVLNAVFMKYGKPANLEDLGPGYKQGGFFLWDKINYKACINIMSYDGNKSNFITHDNRLFSVLNLGTQCPANMKMEIHGYKGAVNSISTLLIDYPTLYKSILENDKMARERQANEAKKRDKRGGPSDL